MDLEPIETINQEKQEIRDDGAISLSSAEDKPKNKPEGAPSPRGNSVPHENTLSHVPKSPNLNGEVVDLENTEDKDEKMKIEPLLLKKKERRVVREGPKKRGRPKVSKKKDQAVNKKGSIAKIIQGNLRSSKEKMGSRKRSKRLKGLRKQRKRRLLG